MPRSCSVCSHPESFAINETLVIENATCRDIAGRYGLSKTAVQRHKGHIPELLVKAKEDLDAYSAAEIFRQIKALQSKTLKLLLEAEGAGDLRTALAGIREARGNLELAAKVGQLIDQAPTVNILVNHPEWVELRTVLITALERYPEVREDVLRAIEEATGAA